MDESYLTGEPYQMSKTPGSTVLSGAINGETALTIRGDQLRGRFPLRARSCEVMREIGTAPPAAAPARRSAGAVVHAAGRGHRARPPGCVSGDPGRFLAVLVVATPCPLLIAIPVAIMGAISLAARRGIIIRDPAVLEKIDSCRTAIFDKTGTLTYGRPRCHRVASRARHLTRTCAPPGRQPRAVFETPIVGAHR